eukprot:TRINITY_DN22222_c0_g1_i1.p1 TRINITY_DN22222_c0_g1~~TRINITY_DN22222_c0_g1_i1.p1  ORF type:complete len:239 (+),score=45.23 TRINITY_DN22222_c0_g1_i1:106-717(+)
MGNTLQTKGCGCNSSCSNESALEAEEQKPSPSRYDKNVEEVVNSGGSAIRPAETRESGSITLPDGATYEGQLVNGKRHGYGRWESVDGETYEGEYVDDLQHGKGVLKWNDGRVYTGQFKDGKFWGEGEMSWSGRPGEEGYVYKGQYEDDRKHGFGTLSWPNGHVYAGEWNMGKRHGTATFKMKKDAEERSGEWSDDRFVRWIS